MVRIHLDDQMDSKALMGAYVCTARPGEFVWQPGPLTQAVAQGRWMLVEDINLAPPEVGAAGNVCCCLQDVGSRELCAQLLLLTLTAHCITGHRLVRRCWRRWCPCWSGARSTSRHARKAWQLHLAFS